MNVPNGYQELVETFGDITKFVRSDGTLSQDWEQEELTTMALPFPMKLAWNLETEVTKIRCHKLLVGILHAVFQEIVNQSLIGSVQTYGGCFSYRTQRGSAHKISTHSWGVALDLNVATNEQGTTGNMDSKLVKVFTDVGFVWGGEFAGNRIDPMHFQWVQNF